MKIAVIGAGGIGSNVCRDLARAIRANQLGDMRCPDVEVFDFDVVENSNLRHQDFTGDDLTAPKVAVMAIKYELSAKPVRFVKEHLANYDTYLICADNTKVRSLVFEHAKKMAKHFVDMRSEGTQIAIFTDKQPLDRLLDSLGKDKESTVGRSCQTPADVAAGVVQMGNSVVAPIGVQILLNMYRQQTYPRYIVEDIMGNRTIKV